LPISVKSASATAGKTEFGYRLTPLRGNLKRFPDTRKRIAFSNAAGVAFVDGGS